MTNFKVGDQIAIISNRYSETSHKLATIDRETKLYWIVGDTKFRKSDGRVPGGDAWTPNANIVPADSSVAMRAERKQRERELFYRARVATDGLGKARSDAEAVAAIRIRITEALDAYLTVVQEIEEAAK